MVGRVVLGKGWAGQWVCGPGEEVGPRCGWDAAAYTAGADPQNLTGWQPSVHWIWPKSAGLAIPE